MISVILGIIALIALGAIAVMLLYLTDWITEEFDTYVGGVSFVILFVVYIFIIGAVTSLVRIVTQ
jgi:hypothetical protein